MTGSAKYFGNVAVAVAICVLQGCSGIFESIYDDPGDPDAPPVISATSQLYIDASDWGKWYYLDLPSVAHEALDNPDYTPADAWECLAIPTDGESDGRSGIYTYWFDVLGEGMANNEFRSFTPTAVQPEPESWTIAVHRDNVRTNGCVAAITAYDNFDQLPSDRSYLASLEFEADRWSEKEVWCEQSYMLLGIIGSQGIDINYTLSSWLRVELPPIPPAFTLCSKVFILKLPDNTYGALQLINYQNTYGVKCCLTINYRYPL